MHCIIATQGEDSHLQHALGSDWKGKLSPLLYACGIGLSFWLPWPGQLLYVLVALMWLVPDQRIERTFG